MLLIGQAGKRFGNGMDDEVMKRLLIATVRFYQRNAPKRFRGRCLYKPTCSNFAIEALGKFGAFWGTLLIVRRFFSCRPPNSGHDPVPDVIVLPSFRKQQNKMTEKPVPTCFHGESRDD